MSTLLVLKRDQYELLSALLGKSEGSLAVTHEEVYREAMKAAGLGPGNPDHEEKADDVARRWMSEVDPMLLTIDFIDNASHPMWAGLKKQEG